MIFRKNLIDGGSVYGTCWNEAGGVCSSSLMFDIVIMVSKISKLVLVEINDQGINSQCLMCHSILKCSFKFDILSWCFWWINNCVFDKVNFLFECLVYCSAVSVCWYGSRRCGFVDWCDGWYFYINGLDVFVWSALISSIFFSSFVSSYNVSASILSPTLILLIVFPIQYSKYVVCVEIFFFFSIIFVENFCVVYFINLLLSEIYSV